MGNYFSHEEKNIARRMQIFLVMNMGIATSFEVKVGQHIVNL